MVRESAAIPEQTDDWLRNMVDATYEWLEDNQFPPLIAIAHYPAEVRGRLVKQAFISASQITSFDAKYGVKFCGVNSSGIVLLDGSRKLGAYIDQGALNTGEGINAALRTYLKNAFGDAVIPPEALKTAEASLLGRILDRDSYTVGLFREHLPKTEMRQLTHRPCLIAFDGPTQG